MEGNNHRSIYLLSLTHQFCRPGSSSLFGFFFENGPIQITADYKERSNKFSWNSLSDVIWVDQPVGVGFSTADETGFGELASDKIVESTY
jgi:hypothetical protein